MNFLLIFMSVFVIICFIVNITVFFYVKEKIREQYVIIDYMRQEINKIRQDVPYFLNKKDYNND